MQIPLNVLLYQLSANALFETQNIDLSATFDGVMLFDFEYTTQRAKKQSLYIITESKLRHQDMEKLSVKNMPGSVFLSLTKDPELNLDEYHPDLPLILIYSEDSFFVVFNRLLDIFLEFERWDKNFHLALLRQEPLQELLNLTKDYIVHPMVILDRSFSLLGYIKIPEYTDPIMEAILDAGYVTNQTMTRLRQDGLLSTSERAENPMINYYCLTTHDCYYSMMYRFRTNNHTVGYAIVFKCEMHPKTNYLYLMNMISENLSLYFQQARFKNRTSSEFYEPLLVELMENPDAPEEQFADRLEYIPGFGVKGRYVLAQIDYDNTVDVPYSFVCWNLHNLIPSLKPFVYQNHLYVIRSIPEDKPFAEFLSAQEEEMFRGSFRDFPFACGISNTFFTMMDLHMAADQCEIALRLGRDRQKEKQVICRFENVYIAYLLEQLKKNVSMKMITSPGYEVLRQYDEEHNSDLCEIFMKYLQNGRNINQTAAEIFLHRNTVLNKVKKAVSVMQNECEDYQTLIAFMLSYLNEHQEE